MERSRLVRRLRSLRNWELFDSLLFLALLGRWVVVSRPQTWYLTTFAVGLVCLLLLAGSLYWHLKSRAVSRDGNGLPEYFCPLFRGLRLMSLGLLACFPLLAAGARLSSLTTARELVWAVAIAGFAGLEYINYFVYQLMHDTPNDLRYLRRHRRLRRAPLAVDLSRCSASRRSAG